MGILHAGHVGQAHDAHQQAANGHFGTHIAEDAHRTQHEVPVGPGAALVLALVGGNILGDLAGVRQPDERHGQCQHHQYARKDEVGHLHRGGLFGLVADQLFGAQRVLLGAGQHFTTQDEERTQQRGHRGAQRVEGLHQGQRPCFLARRGQQGYVGVARHLQQRDAAGQDEQRSQEDAVGLGAGGRIEQHAAQGGNQKAADHAVLVPQPRNELAERNGGDGVGREEAELDQQRLRVVQVEHGLQVWHQNVVQAGDEAQHEEQAGQHGQCLVVVLLGSWGRGCGHDAYLLVGGAGAGRPAGRPVEPGAFAGRPIPGGGPGGWGQFSAGRCLRCIRTMPAPDAGYRISRHGAGDGTDAGQKRLALACAAAYRFSGRRYAARKESESPLQGKEGKGLQLSSWLDRATAAPNRPGFFVSTQYTGMAAR